MTMNSTGRRRATKQTHLPAPESLRSLPAWQARRAAILHSLFLRAEEALTRGQSVREALQPFCSRWAGKWFRTNPSKKARFSYQRVRKLFYQWRRNGRTAAAVSLNYNPPAKTRPTRSQLGRFLVAVENPAVLTMRAAYIKAGLPFTSQSFLRALPATIRTASARLLYAHRQHRSAQRRFAAALVRAESEGRDA